MVTSDHDERAPLLSQHAEPSNGGANRRSASRDDDDDLDFDARFRKWKAAVARKFRGKSLRDTKPALLITQFDGLGRARSILDAKRTGSQSSTLKEATTMTSQEFQDQVEQVKRAIEQGIYPKMITTGSSGSYFARVIKAETESEGTASSSAPSKQPSLATVAVFKPKDEEPYGNLNPKRQFLRKYLWWAMGRPCLIPNFSYLSEVGASYLDARLALRMVPRTELVELSSPTFHYAYHDRTAFDKDGVPLPNKIGSYQTFLKGFVNASDFLRRHPWPSHTRSKAMLMRDMDDESQAHKVSRKKERARLRNCGVAVKRLLLCRPSWDDLYADDEPDLCHPSPSANSPVLGQASPTDQPDAFYWTPKRMEQFRLQLEKLVVLDFLMRNTDRGLDNFMIKHDVENDEIKVGAIDNSLSFPIKHPNEIRQYPFGWLFLPSDLIGLPFSDETRNHLLPILNDPVWWQHTVQGLREIFAQDPYFDESKFERQMSVMRGQGWNLVQCLQDPDEGPLDLCAREKKLIRQEVQELAVDKLDKLDGLKVALDAEGNVLPVSNASRASAAETLAVPKPPISRAISSGLIVTDRRPIGTRASESYRRALLQAAGAGGEVDVDEEFENELSADSLPAAAAPVSSSLPHTSTLEGRMQAESATQDAQQPQSSTTKSARPSRHQRFLSAQDAGTFPRRQRDLSASTSTRGNRDSIIGRTGIEVLEGLDRERKQQNKLHFFRRKRSSTISNGNIPNHAAVVPSIGGGQPGSKDAVTDNDRSYDLSSSIVSDPGARVDGGRWQRSKSTSRPAPEGMYGSLYDLSSQEVLSEEEEEEDQPRQSRDATPSLTRASRQPVPNIQTVLQAHDAKTAPDNEEESSPNAFTPHIPHSNAIGPSVDENNTGHRDPSNRTVKVIIEKISSDTKQAWLKWI
ncbi:Phosphatidylinositol 3-/4-kinase, catalytic domain protein [Kalmanozyma brasiliensis GHG001]|uniref:1-phosphatidylinositol 4-kinase n=1 Tax=Kalmanozyma brasiliensis (strain GHG001) TaxID=1365824 RepID=V5EV56_KALBG|nr:Phosphatidylinositol 3-/4-kinase, catalytic domain protein [Kalmanozyma brasiliensis GHG001]EST07088.1 Phosphatidylinositol 3-/4-kinase, catalytic domain protein [Kalmanozyma brasiliensis GHG001]